MNELSEGPLDATPFDRSENVVLERRTTAALLVRGDVGFAPRQFPLESFLSIGISAMLDPVSFEHERLTDSEFGAAVGLRVRRAPVAVHDGGPVRWGWAETSGLTLGGMFVQTPR